MNKVFTLFIKEEDDYFFCKKDVKLTHIRKQYHEKIISLVDLMVEISNNLSH